MAYARFTNTALVMLLVFNKLPNDASVPVLRHLGILEGTYTGFTSDWYPAVGVGGAYHCCLGACMLAVHR